jgi:predicted nucleotidyltransferase
MAKTALDLSPEERRSFRTADEIHRRKMDHQSEIDVRREEAWRVARQAAELLRDEFGATKVVVFGSLAHADWFTPWSDLDLSAWGIAPSQFYKAVAALMDISSEFRIDLVDPLACKVELRGTIEREGIEL